MAAERRMMKTNYWSHNSAYYPWVLAKTRGGQRVLDVGCGNGELALMLGRGGRSVVGIDPSKECIAEARVRAGGERVRFACASFDDYDADVRVLRPEQRVHGIGLPVPSQSRK